MMTQYPYLRRNLFFICWVCIAWHCDKRFDEPPAYTGLALKPTLSIRELRNMHFVGNFEKILEDHIVEGVVIANDSSDNFYKTIVIQDSTAGISIKLDGTGLYHSYPTGMKIFVRLKDLWLGDYANMVQLGAGVDRTDSLYTDIISIPQPLFARHLKQGSLGNRIDPLQTGIEGLHDSLQSCLITLTGVEMPPSDTGQPYADANNHVSINRTLVDCKGQKINIRTSGFARFASTRTARGHGNITGVYSVFRNQKQIILRDTGDVKMDGLRCTVAGPKQLLLEEFSGTANNSIVSVPGWKNISQTGGRYFTAKKSAADMYAEISAFATRESSVISWLITPQVDLDRSANEVLRFQTRDGFDNGAVLQVLISANYEGGNEPWKAKWAVLPATISKGNISGFARQWVSSGDIAVQSWKGKVWIAFRYEGSDPGVVVANQTTTFQIDNIVLLGN